MRMELLAAGAVVGAFQLLDAVSRRHARWRPWRVGLLVRQEQGLQPVRHPPPWFDDANQLLGWYYYGGGEALYNELITTSCASTRWASRPARCRPSRWAGSSNPIERAEQMRGLKYRTVGLATDLFNEMGAAVVALPGGEIVPALERGVIDGAEFNNPSSDRVLGFPDVAKNYMIQSYHQRTESFEVLFNKAKFDALPAELKAVIRYAAEAASADMSWKLQDRYSNDLQAMAQTQGVNVRPTPRPVLDAQLRPGTA